MEPKPKPDCWTCRAEAEAVSIYDPTCFIPFCDEDGSFSRKQYDHILDESYCVNEYGVEFDGSRVKGKGADCHEYLGTYLKSVSLSIFLSVCLSACQCANLRMTQEK